MTEKQIQNYIWAKRESFADLLVAPQFQKVNIDNPTYASPSDVLYNMIISRYEKLWETVSEIDFFGCEVSLKEEGQPTMRTDFLAIRCGNDGIIVIELKKSDQTARQAYTELLAYGSYLRTKFTPMSGGDIIYVLISPVGERIVEQATINTLIYDNNKVCLLIPKYDAGDINTLKLELWIPDKEIFKDLSYSCFNRENISVSKIVWESLSDEWSPKPGEKPTPEMYKRLNKVSSIAAQFMEERGIHGFVYCAQLIPEFAQTGFDMNAIVLAGVNPYKVTRERFMSDFNLNCSKELAERIIEHGVNMLDILPSLASRAGDINKEENYLDHLEETWTSKLDEIGYEVLSIMTQTFERDYISKEHGDFTWETLLDNSEDYLSDNLDIHLTGIFRQLFFEYARVGYQYIRTHSDEELEDFLAYQEDSIPYEFIDMVNSQGYVRMFIERLANPFLLDDELLEEIKAAKFKHSLLNISKEDKDK